MPEEAAELRRRLNNGARQRLGAMPMDVGWIGRRHVVVLVTGEGRRRACLGIRRLFATYRPDQVLILGLSGALTEDLRAGRLIAAREVVAQAGRHVADPERMARVVRLTGALPARVVSSRELLLDPREKSCLRARLGGLGPAVVDLESFGFVLEAQRARTPWTVLRVVSDTSDEALPGFFARCHTTDGSLDRFQIVKRAAVRPSTWPVLERLCRRARAGSAALADAVEDLCEG
jgi:nucleoside phosphorylase